MTYTLIRSKRKTCAIYIKDTGVEVRAPLRMKQAEIDRFVASKAGWIAQKLTELAARPVAPGQADQAARDCIRVILERRDIRNSADPLESRLKMRNIGNNIEA